MKYIVKATQLSLSYFPTSVKDLIRRMLPTNLKILMGKYVMADTFKRGGIVTVNDGRQFHVIEDSLFLRVYYERDYEPLFSAVARALLEKGDQVVDVGANFGWYSTLFAQSVSPSGKVYAYEPAPHTYHKLVKNLELNEMKDNVLVNNSCVGNTSGTLLFEQGDTSESALAHVVNKKNKSSIELPVTTLDSDLDELKDKIAYIKIDVEGYELLALKGAENILSAPNQPIIQIELNQEALYRAGTSREEVTTFLKSLGYSFWEVDKKSSGTLIPSDVINCSDVFCFGSGKFAERQKTITI